MMLLREPLGGGRDSTERRERMRRKTGTYRKSRRRSALGDDCETPGRQCCERREPGSLRPLKKPSHGERPAGEGAPNPRPRLCQEELTKADTTAPREKAGRILARVLPIFNGRSFAD